MQISLITALAILGYLSPAFASPAGGELRVRSASDISAQEYAAMPDMEFVGPLTPGGPNVTIVGTAKAIYESILEQNPSYNPWDFPEYAERMAAQGLTDSSSVEKRQESHINCDFGTMVGEFSTQCNEGLNYLDRIAGYCGAPPGHAGCSRVSCSHNCAMVLCNDNPFEIHVPCSNIAGDIREINRRCGRELQPLPGYIIRSARGQIFRTGNGPDWNTILTKESC